MPCSAHLRQQLRRICLFLCLLSLTLYLPTAFYLFSSFSDSPEREAFNANIDFADADSSAVIPKRIHQIWVGNRRPPERYVRCAKSWERMSKKHGYVYTMWNETSLTAFYRAHYPHFLERWRNFKYTMNRVDTSKYFLLYYFGGLYADMDVCNVAPDPVERILSDRFLGRKASLRVLLVAGVPAGANPEIMASPPRHPFFKHCLRLLYDSDRRYVFPYLYMMCVGGPCFLTGAYSRYHRRERDILLVGYEKARGQIFSAVKGGEWYNWDSYILIDIIYFGIIGGGIVPHWLSAIVLTIAIFALVMCVGSRVAKGKGGVSRMKMGGFVQAIVGRLRS